jgi:adhesin transport system outer membrane protein
MIQPPQEHTRTKSRAPLLALALVAAGCATAWAQPAGNEALRAAAQKAITGNPEVTARFNAFRAAHNEIDVARGGYFPRLDLSASVGRENDRISSRNPESASLSRSGVALSLSQMLWDGLATSNEVGRLGHAKLTRYFEFVDASEQTALEAARAYHDVLRFRRLVRLAEDNYVQHKYAFDQIQSRVRAGVGRGVDLEQAGARLALAESNLTTEVANLHDVVERYRRVVGEPPAEQLPEAAPLSRNAPASQAELLAQVAGRNPAVAAAIENLRAARAQASVRKSAFQPRVEARLRSGTGRNFDGVSDQRRDSSAELVLNWNLFNGGSDQARVRQAADLLSAAADQRDKACRDARQTGSIAFNDTRKLAEQLVYLDRNVLAIEKARDAYRQQFDIGQRSLLDLLNSENELYTARRSYANAEADLNIAWLRSHAAAGSLVAALGLKREDADDGAREASAWQAGEDSAARCPADANLLAPTPKEELDARARRLSSLTPGATTGSAGSPAATPTVPAAPSPAAAVEQRLQAWANAWKARDVQRYLGFYSPEFDTGSVPRERWLAERRRLVSKRTAVELKLGPVSSQQVAPDRVLTRFEQSYRSADHSDTVEKTLLWQRTGNDWLIVKESVR